MMDDRWSAVGHIALLSAAFGFSVIALIAALRRVQSWFRRNPRPVIAEVRLPPMDARTKPNQMTRLGAMFYDRLFSLCNDRLDVYVEGRPQRAVALRFWAPDDHAFPRIRTLIEGMLPGCEVARMPDGDEDDVADDAWLAIGEMTVASAWRPLRVFDEGDSLGPVMQAHRPPPGVRWVRTHLIITPCMRSWRSRWRRHRLRLQLRTPTKSQRQEQSDNLRRASMILQSASYWVTLRVTAVADTPESAEHEVRQIASVLDSVMRRPDDGWSRVRMDVVTTMSLHAIHAARRAMLRRAGIGCGVGLLVGSLALAFLRAAVVHTPWDILVGVVLVLAAAVCGSVAVSETAPFLMAHRAKRRIHGRRPFILSSPELATVWDASDLGVMLRLSNRFLPPPDIAFQPRDHWVALGYGRMADGSEAPIGVTLRDMRQVVHITAGMGTGKSRLLSNIVDQVGRMPVGMGIIDGKGDDEGSLAWLALDLLPMEREKDIIFLYPLESSYPIALNPLQPSDSDPSSAVNQLLALLSRLDAGGWSRSHGMEQYALHAGILVSEAEPYPTLMHVKRALIDESYRNRLLPSVRNPETRVFWKEIYPAQGKAQRSSVDALIRRIDKVLAPDVVRWIFTSPEPTVNLTRVMEAGQIVIVPLPSERLGGIAYAFGILLTREIVLGAFLRSGTDMGRTDWPLIIDEVQVLLDQTGGNDDFRTMLSRLRSLAVPGVYAHQSLSQLGDLAHDMLVNASNRIILRTPTPDSETYARRYAAYGITAADIARQNPLEHQYFDLVCNGRATGIFSGRPLPWPHSRLPVLDPIPNASWRSVRARPCGTPEGRRLDGRVEDVMQIDAQRSDLLDVCMDVVARISREEWHDIARRWREHCHAQREALLAEPRLEPHHRTRRRLISSLQYGRPLVMAMIDYLYIRHSESIGAPIRRSFAPSAYVNSDSSILNDG